MIYIFQTKSGKFQREKMGYDSLRYIKTYSTGASTSSLGFSTATFGLLIASVLFFI